MNQFDETIQTDLDSQLRAAADAGRLPSEAGVQAAWQKHVAVSSSSVPTSNSRPNRVRFILVGSVAIAATLLLALFVVARRTALRTVTSSPGS